MGDKISRQSVMDAVFEWIVEHEEELLIEYHKASSFSEDYKPEDLSDK
jgi:hypothetical protein